MATAATALLDAEIFSASSQHDVLGRVLTAVSPDGSEVVEATGREHSTQATARRAREPLPVGAQPMASDPSAMRRYTQKFGYDGVGNILKMQHLPASGTGWTRHYDYAETGNRLLATSAPGDEVDGPYKVSAKRYRYTGMERDEEVTDWPSVHRGAWYLEPDLDHTPTTITVDDGGSEADVTYLSAHPSDIAQWFTFLNVSEPRKAEVAMRLEKGIVDLDDAAIAAIVRKGVSRPFSTINEVAVARGSSGKRTKATVSQGQGPIKGKVITELALGITGFGAGMIALNDVAQAKLASMT